MAPKRGINDRKSPAYTGMIKFIMPKVIPRTDVYKKRIFSSSIPLFNQYGKNYRLNSMNRNIWTKFADFYNIIIHGDIENLR